MKEPDLARARDYVLERLQHELAPHLVYHTVAHTRDDVAPAVEQLAALEGVTGEDLLPLRTAAYFHDIGYIERQAGHEALSVQIAGDVLPAFGYSPAHIQVIAGVIMATHVPQSPHTLLEEIMADADLTVFGRQDFWGLNQKLRAEWAASGKPMTDEQWYGAQLDFMRRHHYWTAAARTLYNAVKLENVRLMEKL